MPTVSRDPLHAFHPFRLEAAVSDGDMAGCANDNDGGPLISKPPGSGVLRNVALLLVSIGLVLLAGCATAPPSAPETGEGEVGLASYYADRFQGKPTASGERYDRGAFTAAHRRLDFGTRVRVTRIDNGRSVTVRINDRGPFAAGRIIDLSRAAAEALGMLQAGVVKVRVIPTD